MVVPSGTDAVRAFIPARDFDLSKGFYEALGFKKLLDGDVHRLSSMLPILPIPLSSRRSRTHRTN
jgi:hypothetical protein